MEFYWILCLLALLCTVIYLRGNRRCKKISLFLLFLLMLFISASRVNIGIDYWGHYQLYRIVELGLWEVSEPLYVLLSVFCSKSHIGFAGLIAIMSFITIYPIYRIAQKEQNIYILLLYFLMVYLLSFALIRQCAAISLAIYGSYLYLKEGKKRKAFFFFVLSIGFHYSLAVFVLAFYFSIFFRINFLVTVLLSLFILLIGTNITSIINVISNILKNLGLYEDYLGKRNAHNVTTQLNSGLGVLLRYITYFVILYLANKGKVEKVRANFVNTFFLFLVFADALSLQIQIFLRMRFAFLPCCFIPFFWIKPIKMEGEQISLTNVLLLFLIVAYLLLFPSLADSWENVPYQSIFTNDIEKRGI